MKHARTWRFAAALTMLLGGMLLTASSTWENKDPSQWTSEEIDQILHKSPWVKQTNASLDRSEMQQGGGHSRQSGRMGGGGIGIPIAFDRVTLDMALLHEARSGVAGVNERGYNLSFGLQVHP